MIKEALDIKDSYYRLSKEIIALLSERDILSQDKLVIAICGESGSGKSTTAICLQQELENIDLSAVILHQDNYYKLPPKDNHNKRISDIDWVGPEEVKLKLLQEHIDQFRAGDDHTDAPVVDYLNNQFVSEKLVFKKRQVLIVEGVYAFLLAHLDFKIFMDRTYQDTLAKRKERTREKYTPFVEKVLEIEHQIIAPLKHKTDVTISKDYTIT